MQRRRSLCSCLIYGMQDELSPLRELEYRVSIVSRLRDGDPGFESRQGIDIFIFPNTARPALGPTQRLV